MGNVLSSYYIIFCNTKYTVDGAIELVVLLLLSGDI
jgi:hypothetical protein